MLKKNGQRLKNQAQLVERKQATKEENKTGSYVIELIIRIFLALIVLFVRERAWLNVQIRKSQMVLPLAAHTLKKRKSQMYYLKTCLLATFHSFPEDFKLRICSIFSFLSTIFP